MNPIVTDYLQHWPTHCDCRMLPLPCEGLEKFWEEAWVQAQSHSQELILANNEWTLAELRQAAGRLAQKRRSPLVLPAMHTVQDWCSVVKTNHPEVVSSHARALTIEAALEAVSPQLLGVTSPVSRRALASTLTQLIDALDIAQFPFSDAAQILLQAKSQQVFAKRELAIAQVVATALSDVPGVTQQSLQTLREHAGKTSLTLLVLDKASYPIMRAVAKIWKGPVTVLLMDWNTAPIALNAKEPVSSTALLALAKQIEVISAPHLEAHADAAARTVVRLLQTHPQAQISLIALDRRAARRTRALLDRAGIVVADAAGWRMSTIATSTCVMRLLDIVQYERMVDVLDWAKLPWVANSSLGMAPEALVWLEQFLRSRALSQGLQRISQRIQLQAESEQQIDALRLLQWLTSAKLALDIPRTISAHAKFLIQLLSPVLEQAMQDTGGSQMLAYLQQLALDPAGQSISLEVFYSVVDAYFESHNFVLPTQDARVRILPLGVAVWRASDHIIVLGAQQGLWPQPQPAASIFSVKEQAELGLANHDDGMDSAHVLMTRAVKQHLKITFIHTRSHPEADFEVSPWLELLRLQAKQANIEFVWKDWTPSLSETELSPLHMPRPLAPTLPAKTRLSVSALEALLACPYQFFILRLLGLKNLEVLDESPDRRDFGVLAHAWLSELHKAQLLGKPNNAEHIRQAQDLLSKVLQKAAKGSLHPAQFEAFKKLLSRLSWSLLQWAQSRENSSALTEASFVRTWQGQAQPIELYGRLDRVEITASGASIIDYKTAGQSTLSSRARAPSQYPQLLLYAYLLQDRYSIKDAAFVSIGAGARGEVAHVMQEGDIQELIAQIQKTLEAGLQGLQEKMPLPAHGTEPACQYCEARGICRKDYWEHREPEDLIYHPRVLKK
ncbi:MAG: PD-(D/E)XK nuclease family protein [Burkholderiaceae bacterium]|nr:PD-(D/E)XK nuclease family protein [Burkholderiaceae bacterium]